MSSSKSSGGGLGLGFFSVLFLIFMTLKLCDVIDWSWWFVTMPLWGPFALVAALFVFAVVVFLSYHVLFGRK